MIPTSLVMQSIRCFSFSNHWDLWERNILTNAEERSAQPFPIEVIPLSQTNSKRPWQYIVPQKERSLVSLCHHFSRAKTNIEPLKKDYIYIYMFPSETTSSNWFQGTFVRFPFPHRKNLPTVELQALSQDLPDIRAIRQARTIRLGRAVRVRRELCVRRALRVRREARPAGPARHGRLGCGAGAGCDARASLEGRWSLEVRGDLKIS